MRLCLSFVAAAAVVVQAKSAASSRQSSLEEAASSFEEQKVAMQAEFEAKLAAAAEAQDKAQATIANLEVRPRVGLACPGVHAL